MLCTTLALARRLISASVHVPTHIKYIHNVHMLNSLTTKPNAGWWDCCCCWLAGSRMLNECMFISFSGGTRTALLPTTENTLESVLLCVCALAVVATTQNTTHTPINHRDQSQQSRAREAPSVPPQSFFSRDQIHTPVVVNTYRTHYYVLISILVEQQQQNISLVYEICSVPCRGVVLCCVGVIFA